MTLESIGISTLFLTHLTIELELLEPLGLDAIRNVLGRAALRFWHDTTFSCEDALLQRRQFSHKCRHEATIRLPVAHCQFANGWKHEGFCRHRRSKSNEILSEGCGSWSIHCQSLLACTYGSEKSGHSYFDIELRATYKKKLSIPTARRNKIKKNVLTVNQSYGQWHSRIPLFHGNVVLKQLIPH